MRRAASTADMFWVATFGSVAITLRTSVLMACGVPGMRSPKRRGPKAHRRREPLQTAVRDRGASGRSASFERSIPTARSLAPLVTVINSSSFTCKAVESRICVAWITNTIKNVSTVVPVLTTSCHASEKWKNGPDTSQARIATAATSVANGEPVTRVTASENRTKPPGPSSANGACVIVDMGPPSAHGRVAPPIPAPARRMAAWLNAVDGVWPAEHRLGNVANGDATRRGPLLGAAVGVSVHEQVDPRSVRELGEQVAAEQRIQLGRLAVQRPADRRVVGQENAEVGIERTHGRLHRGGREHRRVREDLHLSFAERRRARADEPAAKTLAAGDPEPGPSDLEHRCGPLEHPDSAARQPLRERPLLIGLMIVVA